MLITSATTALRLFRASAAGYVLFTLIIDAHRSRFSPPCFSCRHYVYRHATAIFDVTPRFAA